MDKAPGKRVRITMDGPYEILGDVPLQQNIIETDDLGESVAWKEGKTYQPKTSPYNLCRCGHSRDKPYCDGSHDDAGFCGKEMTNRPPYEQHAQHMHGQTADLLDDPSLCVTARFCDRGETVWGYVEKSGEPGFKEKAVKEACNCPSGRLTVREKDGKSYEPKLEPGIGVVEDPANNCRGPLWVKGGIEIVDKEGRGMEVRNRVTLCRCGESQNQPYCDGSHYNCPTMQGLDE